MAKDLPCDLKSGRLSELTFAIGGDSTKRNEFFKKRCSRLEKNEYLSFDSTKIASQSCRLADVRKGPSKRGGHEDEIGLALLFGSPLDRRVVELMQAANPV